METYPKITLKPGKEYALLRFHPWVFSGAVLKASAKLKEGEVVEVFSSSGDYLATGHCQTGGIAVKALSFRMVTVDQEFWTSRIRSAVERRNALGMNGMGGNNACRLVYSEGDGLPGLIIDWYNGVAVIQTHSMGMHLAKPSLVIALQEVMGSALRAVYDKSSDTMRSDNEGGGESIADGFLYGSDEEAEILETGHRFRVDFIRGQKTGFFLDQRGNRMYAQFYARNRKVLNAFCYSGAFSVYAAKGGATMVHSVDSSRQAVQWTKENMDLNGIPEDVRHETVADVKRFLPDTDEKYDLIILDPPAFAKRHNITHNALQAYIRINTEALKKLTPDGILFTFSCSQAISREMFRSAIQSAGIEAGKGIRVLHTLSQGPDHPVSIFHPEGEYLKGLILQAE